MVFRTDASGDNFIFSDYLQTLQGSAWYAFTSAREPGREPRHLADSPDGAAISRELQLWELDQRDGSDTASGYVYGNPDSITYVETA